jgi:hypothetical protein
LYDGTGPARVPVEWPARLAVRDSIGEVRTAHPPTVSAVFETMVRWDRRVMGNLVAAVVVQMVRRALIVPAATANGANAATPSVVGRTLKAHRVGPATALSNRSRRNSSSSR